MTKHVRVLVAIPMLLEIERIGEVVLNSFSMREN